MSTSSSRSESWAGVVIFAAVMMFVIGAGYLIVGLSLVSDPKSVAVSRPLVLSKEAWGWIYLVGGVITILAGIGLYRGATWARGVASFVVAANLLGAFAGLSGNPWSLAVIAIDIVVLWALGVHGNALRLAEQRET